MSCNNHIFLSDNTGNRVPPGVIAYDPVLASGQTLVDSASGGDHTVTVVEGASYILTVMNLVALVDAGFIFGLAAVTTAANILWVCPPGRAIHIKIPSGYTALHYASILSGGTAYLTRID